MSGDGAHLYATHPGNNQVTQVATSTHAAVTTFNVGTWPIGRGDFVIDCSEPGGPVDVCGTTHYDSGGPTGNYGNSEDVVETLCPNDPDDKVILHFMAFELESGYDFLKIYDGETTNDPPLHTGEGFSGSLSPGSLYATQPSGCLTLHFTSDATINLAGWAAEVECAPVDCGTTNYDSGGPTGHYGNNEDSTMTFCPVLDGDKVEMTFMAFDLENGWDFLKIYDGPTTGAPALHSGQGFTGTIIPGPFISTHETGCLTIRFTSDGSFTRPGWEAAIECRPIVCDTDFFDSGGPGGEYANNESSTTILCPDQPGEYIELEFLSFALEEGFDFLQVFDGLATTDPPLHPGNGFTGSTLPGTLVSSHPSGCLTAHFTSDGSVTMEGWAAHVNCREPSACGTIFADSGGPAGNYQVNEDSTTVLCPSGPDEVIRVAFTAFDVESQFDALYIFDGPSTSSPLLHSGNPATLSGFPAGGYYGTNLPGTFISSDPGGCLTFQFLSDPTVTRPGWSADVDCLFKPAHDECANAIEVICAGTFVGSNETATRDQNAACQSQDPGIRSVWHRFAGTGDMITVSTCGTSTSFDTKIIVYTGSCANLTCLAANDDNPDCALNTLSSEVTFASVAGEEYYILLSGFSSANGTYEIHVECEAACTAHVTSAADDGPGSLRSALLCPTAGDTITFDPVLNGQYIDITSDQIIISRNIVMAPDPGQQIRVRATGDHRIMLIQEGTTVRIENIELLGGTVLGGAIFNEGTLILQDVVLKPHPDEPENVLVNSGMVTVIGLVEIKPN
jgi:hypothetical protein